MKILYFFKTTCLLSFLTTTLVFSQGYQINISLKSNNDTVILGHYFAKNTMYVDDTVILKKGKGVFTGKKPLAKGLYFIINHNRKLGDIMMGDEQKFSIEIDTTDVIKNHFTSSVENTVFYDYLRYNTGRGNTLQRLSDQFQKATSEKERNEIREKIQILNNDRLAYIQQLIDAHSDLYVSKFLNMLVPMETKLPDYPRDAASNITDSTYVYRWYRAHFFDNLDIYDPDMLRTPLYEEKVFEYITKAIPQHPDTICVEVDKILAKAQANNEIFRYISLSVFSYYVKSNVMVHENIWVHIADK